MYTSSLEMSRLALKRRLFALEGRLVWHSSASGVQPDIAVQASSVQVKRNRTSRKGETPVTFKQSFISVALALTMVLTMVLVGGCSQQKVNEKPVIVIAAFGSSMEQGLKNLGDFDSLVRDRFPDYDIRWALTAGFIIDKLKEAGVTTMFDSETPIKSLDDVYEDLRQEGKTNVVVQCLLVMPGAEMRQVLSYRTDGLNVKYGYPLLFSPENIQNAANALDSEFGGPDTGTILCAHGNEAHPEFNSALVQMDTYLRENYDNVYLATVEGPPGCDEAIEEVQASGVSQVKFVPLMLVEGDHITNDVMGDEPESWKVLVDLPATNATGMASNPDVMEIFLKSIQDLVSQF
jgi:sirohydrochlorin cobaltochelatase